MPWDDLAAELSEEWDEFSGLRRMERALEEFAAWRRAKKRAEWIRYAATKGARWRQERRRRTYARIKADPERLAARRLVERRYADRVAADPERLAKRRARNRAWNKANRARASEAQRRYRAAKRNR